MWGFGLDGRFGLGGVSCGWLFTGALSYRKQNQKVLTMALQGLYDQRCTPISL